MQQYSRHACSASSIVSIVSGVDMAIDSLTMTPIYYSIELITGVKKKKMKWNKKTERARGRNNRRVIITHVFTWTIFFFLL